MADNPPPTAPEPPPLFTDADPSALAQAAWHLVWALHGHLPEDKRPQGWMDLSEEQNRRIRWAMHAIGYENLLARADALAGEVDAWKRDHRVECERAEVAIVRAARLAGEVERLKAATDYFEATMLDQQAKRERAESALSAMTAERDAAVEALATRLLHRNVGPHEAVALWRAEPDSKRGFWLTDARAMVALFAMRETPATPPENPSND